MPRDRVVQLKDQSTSFHDFETEFDIVRSQKKPLGTSIGRATAVAIQTGRLIDVTFESDDEPTQREARKGK
jgi:beta-lactam-binding protein with PASTA domain